MAARRKMALTLVLGTWLGASFLLLWVVGSSFPGVERAVVENEQLASRVGFKPGDAAAKKTSVAWVITGELNRQNFSSWNAGQLLLAAAALFCALRAGSRGALLGVCGAGVLVLVLTFWLAPEITTLGRSLDFVPRDPPPAALERFNGLHGIYTSLELAKVLLLLLAVWFSFRSLSAARSADPA
tara:strand:+ start:954 stop:1505 length:552 start_codon:yes stop_codon:yes gene_type:complete